MSLVHATQVCDVGSQCGVLALDAQSPSARQPTHVSLLPLTKQCEVVPVHVPPQGTCASTFASVPPSFGAASCWPPSVAEGAWSQAARTTTATSDVRIEVMG
jgi:hypothetical protein